jgi:hypothetical protein
MTFLKEFLENVDSNRTRLLLLASATIGVLAGVFYLRNMDTTKLNKLNFAYSKVDLSDPSKDAENSRFEILKKK